MNEEEIWMPVIGYEDFYEVSSEGNVRSIDRKIVYNNGRVCIHKGKVIKSAITRDGYLRVGLHKEGKRKWFRVHRLVYAAFNGEIPDEMQINHINEIKTDNRLENLNLMTCKENINFGTRTERMAKAQTNHPLKSKPVVAFDEAGNVILEFSSAREAARNGFNRGDISNCCSGRYKTHRGYRWKYKEDIEKT